MPTVNETVANISSAATWEQRIASLRLIPRHHGTAEQSAVYAAVARKLYVPHLAPDFAYIHRTPFHDPAYFEAVYRVTDKMTRGFRNVDTHRLTAVLMTDPRTLLVLRTITGLTKEEFAQSTALAAETMGIPPVSPGQVDAMERRGAATGRDKALVIATTLTRVMDGTLFSEPPELLASKQAKADTAAGWKSVRKFAGAGVPYSTFLHQRHSGGSFRQVLDATSSLRGEMLEDAVEAVLKQHGVRYLRTSGNRQGSVEAKLGVRVTPAPDFVILDGGGAICAIIECKRSNNGGSARDKAARFAALREEAMRHGGIPVIAVLGGTGWARVNDSLGPIVRDTDGRVFTLSTLTDMLQVPPFTQLVRHPPRRPRSVPLPPPQTRRPALPRVAGVRRSAN